MSKNINAKQLCVVTCQSVCLLLVLITFLFPYKVAGLEVAGFRIGGKIAV